MAVRVCHILMFLDAVLGHEAVAAGDGFLFYGCPGEKIASYLDVVVRELA